MIEIRACDGMDELEACVQLEIETWGYDATEIVPRKTFLLAQKIGGQVIGAFETGIEGSQGGGKLSGTLIGFVLSLPGVKSSAGKATPYLHSHMLAVRPEFRNSGIGAQLKWEQRHEALGRGIGRIEWTFDPLEIKNAFLNIHRLGAVCRSYRPNFYGVSSSRLQGGLPTDRLLAEWELESGRVESAREGLPASLPVIQERIVVPAAMEHWKANDGDRSRALDVQTENRLRFQDAFARGFAVVGFSTDALGNGTFELGCLDDLK